MKATIRVPASSANLGPGVDTLGLGLALYLRVEMEEAAEPSITFGEGFAEPLAEEDNLVLAGVRALEAAAGKSLPPLAVSIDSAIPLSRGLGSSAAAIVAGVLGANALLGEPLSRGQCMAVATSVEGHPDNIAPAMLGGLTAALQDGDDIIARRLPTPALHAVLAIPDAVLSTKAARAVLPETVSLRDAIGQVQRVSLLLAALLGGEGQLLRAASQDRLFTPYRRALIPAFDEAERAALDAGALFVAISGAGPSILALTGPDAAPVEAALARAYAAAGVPGRVQSLAIDEGGAIVRLSEGGKPCAM